MHEPLTLISYPLVLLFKACLLFIEVVPVKKQLFCKLTQIFFDKVVDIKIREQTVKYSWPEEDERARMCRQKGRPRAWTHRLG